LKEKIINTIVSATVGAGAGVLIGKNAVEKKVNTYKNLSDKHQALMLLFNQWMITKQEGKSVVQYFEKNNYKSIAIYGMSHVGQRLYDEIKNSGIDIRYVIDKNADYMHTPLEVVTLDAELKEVDVIVVTPVFFFDEIKGDLEKKINCPIVSLEDILYEI